MKGIIERQVIVTWYTPEEKLPPEYQTVVVSISGHIGKTIFDHALEIAEWADDGCGWERMEVKNDNSVSNKTFP